MHRRLAMRATTKLSIVAASGAAVLAAAGEISMRAGVGTMNWYRRKCTGAQALILISALTVAACAETYDPPQVFDEVFANGGTTEVASGGFGGLKGIVERDNADGPGLPARVLWTHGMCTPNEGPPSRAWWQVRTDDLIAAYTGAAPVPDSIEKEPLPNGSTLIKETLHSPGSQSSSRTIELWFFDWAPLTAPYKPTGARDPENPPDNRYRYDRATLNENLKQGLIKDCFADVVMYLGKNGDPIRSDTQTVLCEFFGGRLDPATGCAGALATRATMLISESLGSSILFDGFRSLKFDYMREPPPTAAGTTATPAKGQYSVRLGGKGATPGTSDFATRARTNSRDVTTAMTSLTSFFMLANQIPLMSLANGPRSGNGITPLEEFIAGAAELRPATAPPLTIVAFVDPNDLLSFRLIPKSDRARIVNFVVSNADTYAGYAERPDEAHCNYVRNAYVMHAIVFGYAGGAPQRGPVNDPEPCLQVAPGKKVASLR
jgi:hypothetical protein